MSLLGYAVPAAPRPGAGPDGRHRRRAPVPRPPDRDARTSRSWPPPASRPPAPGSAPSLERVGHRPPGRRQGVQVLDGHAPAPRGGRLPARGPPAAHPGRAHERARPRRHARHAGDDPARWWPRAAPSSCRPTCSTRSSGRATPWPSSTGATVIRQGPIADLLAGCVVRAPDRLLRPRAGPGPPGRHALGRQRRRRSRRAAGRPAGGHRAGRWSPRSTGSWWRVGSRSTGSRRSRPRSNRGSSQVTSRLGEDAMTTVDRARPARPAPAPPADATAADHRGSWVPNGAMIATRFMELRKRRGLMVALVAGDHRHPRRVPRHPAAGPRRRPPLLRPGRRLRHLHGLVAGVLYVFGFIVAATVGCTAGSVDLTEGMFRHLVVTGRSRLALYLARIPAGLAIIVPMVAVGFTIVCAVCVFAAPTQLNYDGVNVPAGLSRSRTGQVGDDPRRRGHLRLPVQHRAATRPHPGGQRRPVWGRTRSRRQHRRSAPGRRPRRRSPTPRWRRRPGRSPSGLHGLHRTLPVRRRSPSWCGPACGSSS